MTASHSSSEVLTEHAIAEEAGVVHQRRRARRRCRPPCCDQALGLLPVGDVGAVGDGLAAHGPDGVDHLAGRAAGATRAVDLGAEVVDHDLGTLAGELEGVRPADAPSRPVTMTTRPSQIPVMARNDAQDLTVRQNRAVRYGVTIFPTDLSIGVVELARALEERDLDSLWLPEHTHIPTSRKTPWPVDPTGQTPIDEKYKRSLDPLVALGAAAVATERLRLGTGILLAAQRDPIVTAKAIASLDHLSGGRAAIGVGFG